MRRLSSAFGEVRRMSATALQSLSGKGSKPPPVVEEPAKKDEDEEDEEKDSDDEEELLRREQKALEGANNAADMCTYKVVYKDGVEVKKKPKASSDPTGENFEFGDVLHASLKLMKDDDAKYACLPDGRGWVAVQIRSIVILKDMVNRTDIIPVEVVKDEKSAADFRKNQRRSSNSVNTLTSPASSGRRSSTKDSEAGDGKRRGSSVGQVGGGRYIDLTPKAMGMGAAAVDPEVLAQVANQLRQEMAQRDADAELERQKRDKEAAFRKQLELQRRDAERAAEIEHINQRALAASAAAKETQTRVNAAVKEAQAQADGVVADMAARVEMAARQAEIRIQAAAELRLQQATSALEGELKLLREREGVALANLQRMREREQAERRCKLEAEESLALMRAAELGKVTTLQLLEPPLGATFFARRSPADADALAAQPEADSDSDVAPSSSGTLQIETVEPNGAAQRAKLAPGDVLVGVRDRPLLPGPVLLALLSDPGAYPLTLYFRCDEGRRRKTAMLLHLERRAASRAAEREHEERTSVQRAKEAAEWQARAYEFARQRWELEQRSKTKDKRDEERSRTDMAREDWCAFGAPGEWWREERELERMGAHDGLLTLRRELEGRRMQSEDALGQQRVAKERERLRRRVRRLQGRRRALEQLQASDPDACRAAGLQGDGPLRGYPHTWLASTALGQLAERLTALARYSDARLCVHRALDVIHLHAPTEGCEFSVVFLAPPLGLMLRQGENQKEKRKEEREQERERESGEEGDESRFGHLPIVSGLVPRSQASRLGVSVGCRVLRVGEVPAENFEGVVDALMLAVFPLTITFRRPDWDDGWLRWDSDGEEEEKGDRGEDGVLDESENDAGLESMWDAWTAEVLAAGSEVQTDPEGIERRLLAARLLSCVITEPGPTVSAGGVGVEILGAALENWAEICTKRELFARADAAIERRLALLSDTDRVPETPQPRLADLKTSPAALSPSRPKMFPPTSSPSPKTRALSTSASSGSKKRRELAKQH